MGECPNTTEGGCRCPEHAPGLMAHTSDPAAYEAALRRCRPVALRVVTFGDEPERVPLPDLLNPPKPCEGGYTCECSACERERSQLVKRGVRPLRRTYARGRAA